MSRLFDGLNDAQRAAVAHTEGPMLVLAGPGSGKTRVITHRIAHMVNEVGIPSSSVLAVTFTNKAADEMRHRLASLIVGRPPLTCTFHGFCARMLRRYGERAGFEPNFSILDESDRSRALTSIIKEMGLDTGHFPPGKFQHRISNLKNELTSPAEFQSQAADYFDRLVADVYPRYQERLKEQNAFDFDDLLFVFADLLRRDEEVRTQLDERFRYILVDEYQDTNLAQYAIARGMSLKVQNLCVTGDPDQSIYGWRGANLNNILHFEDDFPGASVFRLEQNYRSTANILSIADQLIRQNSRRKHKELITDNPPGSRVRVICYQSDDVEANAIANDICEGVEVGGRRFGDVAIFVRVSSLTRPFEAAFRARHIPYQVIGGYSFFERKEIRDVVAYLRLTLNPKDDAAYLRAVGSPPRGIGQRTLERLATHARAHGISLAEATANVSDVKSIKGKPAASLRSFGKLLRELEEIKTLAPAVAIDTILSLTAYRDQLDDLPEEERQTRLGLLEEMIGAARSWSVENPEEDLLAYMEQAALTSDADRRDASADVVTLMTLHAAKGLEFPIVYLVAFEHDILPHQRGVEEGNEEEERRLAFVGITRAREELTISYTQRRLYQGRTNYMSPSPFLAELPDDFLDREDRADDWREGADSFADDYSQEPSWEEPSIPLVHGASGPSPADRFYRGMAVRHPVYGQGLILQLEGAGEDRKATIEFPSVGPKRFVLCRAPVEPA
ncbi:ATP-dependent DNA helicase PcrA [Planctomycetes bacterium Pan216]|uniref:DNA 3'-5' helicase n=1 Tax=Kolteria novifilia TaxID=2527975 RepID=A0A518B698_9BACT|nr:ATP-dependent DNA helicase PcrA [Planctomycetes bacterium Pan216]